MKPYAVDRSNLLAPVFNKIARYVCAAAISALLSGCSNGQGPVPQVPPTLGSRATSTSTGEATRNIRYTVVDMGTFGGASSQGTNLNASDVTVGWSATSIQKRQTSHPICGGLDGVIQTITHAFHWENGSLTDLGAFAPARDNCSFPFAINDGGEVVGLSEISQIDPFVGFDQARAVRWRNGVMAELGSLGGNQSAAFAINNRGQIVGTSENTTPDPFVFLGLGGTQTRAVLWENGKTRDLGTLGGNDAQSLHINDSGQVIGISYTSAIPNPVTQLPPLAPFFWDHGRMINIGNFGGADGFPNAMNNRGQVIGGSSTSRSPGACGFLNFGGPNFPDPDCHPFFWNRGELIDLATSSHTFQAISANAINQLGEVVGGAAFPGRVFDAYLYWNGAVIDLGTLPGDCSSEAWGINNRGQIVGDSYDCGGFAHHAFLWEHGVMQDLNNLVPRNSPLQLVDVGPLSFAGPQIINDRGAIGGTGLPQGTALDSIATVAHAFLLVPKNQNDFRANPEQDIKITAPLLPKQSPAEAALLRLNLARIHAHFRDWIR